MKQVNKSENKYQRGKIYKIVSFQTEKVYVGSTCEPYLSNRLSKHRSNYRDYKNEKSYSRYMTSFDLLQFDDIQIILLENYPCNDKYELESRERHWIEQLDCVNKFIPTRGAQERQNEYRKNNKDRISKKSKEYREKNREIIRQQKKESYQKNRDTIIQKNAEYNKSDHRKAYRCQKIKCECGGQYVKAHSSTHAKTNRHQEYLNEIPLKEAILEENNI